MVAESHKLRPVKASVVQKATDYYVLPSTMLNDNWSLFFLALLSWLGDAHGVSNIFSPRSILYNREPKAKQVLDTEGITRILSGSVEIGDYIYYLYQSSIDFAIRRSDGETAERVVLQDADENNLSVLELLGNIGNSVYFSVVGGALYVTNVQSGVTEQLGDASYSDPQTWQEFRGDYYFNQKKLNGSERHLFRIDGITGALVLVHADVDIQPSFPLLVIGDNLIFVQDTGGLTSTDGSVSEELFNSGELASDGNGSGQDYFAIGFPVSSATTHITR